LGLFAGVLMWIVTASALLAPTPCEAQAEAVEEMVREGNRAYNKRKYDQAVRAYTLAIQAAPDRAFKAYLNMARAYNQLRKYDHAAQYYEWYLGLEDPQRSKRDRRKVEAEFKRVARRRSKPVKNIVTTDQQNILVQLRGSLSEGPFLTAEGGGALATYRLLIRTGYAAPDLRLLQQALASGLVEEAFRESLPFPGAPIPASGRDGWNLVMKRLDQAERFGYDASMQSIAIGLRATARGWQAYFAGDFKRALDSFSDAITGYDKILAAHWGRVLASARLDSGDFATTLKLLDEAEASYRAQHRELQPFMPLLRARILHLAGRDREAAQVIATVQLTVPKRVNP